MVSSGIWRGGKLTSPPHGWPEAFSANSQLKAFMGKRGLQGRRVRLVGPATAETKAVAAGITMRPHDPFGTAELVRDQTGWALVKGFAIFQLDDGQRWVGHKRWWNEKPSGTWVDLTPRPDGLCSMVLVESALAVKTHRPASDAARAAAMLRLEQGGLCLPTGLPTGSSTGLPTDTEWPTEVLPLPRQLPAPPQIKEHGGTAVGVTQTAGLPPLTEPPVLPDMPRSMDEHGAVPSSKKSGNAGTAHMQMLGIVGSHRPSKAAIMEELSEQPSTEEEARAPPPPRRHLSSYLILILPDPHPTRSSSYLITILPDHHPTRSPSYPITILPDPHRASCLLLLYLTSYPCHFHRRASPLPRWHTSSASATSLPSFTPHACSQTTPGAPGMRPPRATVRPAASPAASPVQPPGCRHPASVSSGWDRECPHWRPLAPVRACCGSSASSDWPRVPAVSHGPTI